MIASSMNLSQPRHEAFHQRMCHGSGRAPAEDASVSSRVASLFTLPDRYRLPVNQNKATMSYRCASRTRNLHVVHIGAAENPPTSYFCELFRSFCLNYLQSRAAFIPVCSIKFVYPFFATSCAGFLECFRQASGSYRW